jgi:hypothetical protein
MTLNDLSAGVGWRFRFVEDAMKAIWMWRLATVLGGGLLSAGWNNAEPAQAAAAVTWIGAQPVKLERPDALRSGGLVSMVQWRTQDLYKEYWGYKINFSQIHGTTPEMLRCYRKCFEEVYDDDKLIRPDTWRHCVARHWIMPDGCEQW